MKTFPYLLLFLGFTIGLLCCTTESSGQCEVAYNYVIKNAGAGAEDGEIEISFSKTSAIPNCLLFTYSANIPYLLLEAKRKVDTASSKVTFYGLAPGRYTIRAGQKNCKTFFIGEHATIAVGIKNDR